MIYDIERRIHHRETVTRVGIVGIGSMGLPIAINLSHSGFDVHVFDVDCAQYKPLQHRALVTLHPCPLSLARSVEIVVLLTPNGQTALRTIRGHGSNSGIASVMTSEQLVVDMGSSAPEDTLAMAETLRHVGVGFVDAPVSKGVKGAVDRELTVIVGGTQSDVDRARQVLLVLAKNIFHVGPVSSAQTVKALNNYLSAMSLYASCEVFVAAKAQGIDLSLLLEVLNASSGMSFSTTNKIGQHVISRTFSSGMSTGLLVKDLRAAKAVFNKSSVASPLLSTCLAQWSEIERLMGQDSDHTEAFKFVESRAWQV